MTEAMKLTAELVAYSSVVGRSITFKNEAGACVALVMVSVPNPQFDYRETAEPIANLIAAAPDMLAALTKAEQFIANGIELGFIRMPEASTPDPAHDTLPLIRAALAKAQGART